MSYDYGDMTVREYEQMARDRAEELDLLGNRMEREDRQGAGLSRREFRDTYGREKKSDFD